MTTLPQFPLGLVLFPTMMLPLHVFEPRYRAMVHHVLDGDQRFGVVMIERGTDTGGDDQRSNFGTVAKVVEAEEFPDGRWALVTVGIERFKVNQWLADDPYPQADVEMWADSTPDGPSRDEFDRVALKFRRCMALTSEAGLDIGPVPETLECGEVGTMQMAAMLPVGPFDKQQLLGISGSVDRLAAIDEAIDTTMDLIDLRLQGG
jgi:Lon protease-like protein